MFLSLSNLPAVNGYLFIVIMVCVSYIAVVAGRSAYMNLGRSLWLRLFRGGACALLIVLIASTLTVGRWIPADQVGVGKERVYSSGWHVYPRERLVVLPRAGMFHIPYPDEERFLEVSYLITDSERLKFFSEEIEAFKTPIAEGFLLFGSSKRDAWKSSGDPFAAWLLWKTTKYLPSTDQAPGRIEEFLATLGSFGVSTDARLFAQQWRSRR
jgi:hypothetical protein